MTTKRKPVARDRNWTVKLSMDREVGIGSSVDEDPGIWIRQQFSLLRWMTADDARAIRAALDLAIAHFEANPVRMNGRRK